MKVVLPNNDLTLWHVNFQGAKGTLYEGENFVIQLRFTNDYVPFSSLSPSNPQKSYSLDTFPSTNTSTLMVSSASPFYTTVCFYLSRMVTRTHCQLYLPVGSFNAQQC